MKTGKIDLQEWERVERVESFSFLFLTADTDMGTEMGCTHTHTQMHKTLVQIMKETKREKEGLSLSLQCGVVWCGVPYTQSVFLYF